MGSDESVGSYLTSPPPPSLFANPNPISHRTQRDTSSSSSSCCFYCKKQGHWSNNCPEKQKTLLRVVNKETTTPTTLSSDGGTIPDMQCPCGGGICYVLTSKTEKNPGRQFYKCPRKSACSFFEWCDELSSDQGVRVAAFPYPMCTCGAGLCNRFKVMQEGNKNLGRFFFVCPVTKGQGACNFFQWEDETKQSPQSTSAVQESPEQGANESVVRGSESKSTEEYPVKEEEEEEEEVGRSNSGEVDEKILSPMRNLRVSEESNSSPVVAKPWQWMKECFKCGETGHWKRDCTA